MPSEDNLTEPVPTSHFTGQQGQGLRLRSPPAPQPPLTLLLSITAVGASHQWALGLHRNKSLPAP